jgi:small-conductance mechanosensitive channel
MYFIIRQFIQEYWLFAGFFLAGLIVLKLMQMFVLSYLYKLAKKTKNDFDDVLIKIVSELRPPLYLVFALYLPTLFLDVSAGVRYWLNRALLFIVVWEGTWAVNKLVDYMAATYVKRYQEKGQKQEAKSMVNAISIILKLVVFVSAVLLVLANLGVNVTSLVASLGIGGLAVALALQTILSDIFSSFSIFVDKPFQTGDFIKVGADSGTVEHIGLKSTRLRTMQGEELVISNKELTSARVQNFKKLQKRRVTFTLGVVYGTSQKKLAAIPQIVQSIIESKGDVEFQRCYLGELADSSLNFECSFFVENGNFDAFVNVRALILAEIYDAFNREKIDFAYPTQEVILKKG